MSESFNIGAFQRAGINTINREGEHDHDLIPLLQDSVVFQQMFEYPVTDFEAEVGFFVTVLGLSAIALTTEYALFKHPENGYCISFRKDVDSPAPSTIGLKLLFMTTDIPAAHAHLDGTELVPDHEIRKGSPVQDVIYFSTPAGVAVEIWHMPTDE